MSNRNRTPSLANVIEEAIRDRLTHLHTNLPAKVISYDAAMQTATVKPTLKQRIPTDAGAALVDFPIIQDVPVCHPRWGSWFVHAPLAEGDFVDLIFGEASIDRWRELSGEQDPQFDHRFDLSDAIALPMNLYPVAKALVGLSATAFSIGKMNSTQIHIDDGAVLMGSALASIPVATSPLVVAQLITLANGVAALCGAVSYLGTATTGAIESIAATLDAAAPGTGAGRVFSTPLTGAVASSATSKALALTAANTVKALQPESVGSTLVKVDT